MTISAESREDVKVHGRGFPLLLDGFCSSSKFRVCSKIFSATAEAFTTGSTTDGMLTDPQLERFCCRRAYLLCNFQSQPNVTFSDRTSSRNRTACCLSKREVSLLGRRRTKRVHPQTFLWHCKHLFSNDPSFPSSSTSVF